MVKIGIIGGTGCGGFSLENLNAITSRETHKVTTIWGAPSDVLTTGLFNGVPTVLLGRHGPGHKFNPTNVPYKANIQALKDIGCTHVIATSACGSLTEKMAPGDIVIIDQFIDWTTKRATSFFDGTQNPTDSDASFSRVRHVPMAEPFCSKTRGIVGDCCRELNDGITKHHESGTMITIEGPRFSTRAESHMFRALGANLINMTTSTEASLAKEAGLAYVVIASVTDYDSWRIEIEDVSVGAVVENAKKSQTKVFELICKAVEKIGQEDWEETLKKLSDDVINSQM